MFYIALLISDFDEIFGDNWIVIEMNQRKFSGLFAKLSKIFKFRSSFVIRNCKNPQNL